MTRTRLAPAALALAAFAYAAPAADPLPPDIPGNAAAVVHLKVREITQGPDLAIVRDVVRKAGPQALAALDKFAFTAMDIDTVTAFATMQDGQPGVAAIVRLTKAVPRAKLAQLLAPAGQAGGDTWTDPALNVAYRPLTDKSFAVGPNGLLQNAFKSKPGPLPQFKALEPWADRPLLIAGDATKLPAEAWQNVPEEAADLLKVKGVALGLRLGVGGRIDVRVEYATTEEAATAEAALRKYARVGKEKVAELRGTFEQMILKPQDEPSWMTFAQEVQALSQVADFTKLEAFLADPPFKREKTTLTAGADIPHQLGSGGVLVGAAVIGAVAGVTLVGQRANATFQAVGAGPPDDPTTSHMKQLGLAMHSHTDTHNKLPAQAVTSKDGKKPLLSWRVELLPYLEQDELYKQFKRDEPWDSDHNKKLIEKMPDVFKVGGLPNHPADKTHFQVFAGKGAVWTKGGPAAKLPLGFTDGTSNTFLVVEAAEPVIWTKPDDLEYDAAKPLQKLGADAKVSYFRVAMADGSVRKVKKDAKSASLKAYITPAGGEVPDESVFQP